MFRWEPNAAVHRAHKLPYRKLHAGAIGKVHLTRCYYNSLRGPSAMEPSAATSRARLRFVARPCDARPLSRQYPAIQLALVLALGGEMANNGVHGLDLCRWGLDVDFPVRTVSSGGRYWYDDDQQTPDVQSACFEFDGGKQATWSALSCNRHGPDYICAFYGDDGSLELDPNGVYRIFDRNDKQIEAGEQANQGDVEHLQNFIDAVRAGNPSRLNQPIVEGHKSTLLCHLGNIAYRTGETVQSDSKTGRLLGTFPSN
ncbi:MAG: hypothetical protein R3C56_34540 [Pirellulaceae bacterium]